MKNKSGLLFLLFLMIALFKSCSVNEHTGAVTIVNYTETDALNLKIGNLYAGIVRRGETRTLYFLTNQDDASITSNNFDARYGNHLYYGYGYNYSGTIDLKKGYSYLLELRQRSSGSTAVYYIDIEGIKIGINTSDRDSNDNTISKE